MSSNYPEGSMRGSGIYAEDVCLAVECSECGHSFDADLTTDDWGNIDNDVVCENKECGQTFNVTREASDYSGYDEDAAYDDWRDSQD